MRRRPRPGRRRAGRLLTSWAVIAVAAGVAPVLILGASAATAGTGTTTTTSTATTATSTTTTTASTVNPTPTITTATATPSTTDTPPFAPAAGQPDPTNPWDSKPIPEVAAATAAARADAPLPANIVPVEPDLLDDAYPTTCAPEFGPGVTPSQICLLGDSDSRRVVVVFGDSHAGRWVTAVAEAGQQDGFAVVPLAKAGCEINVYRRESAVWPCRDWYRWAIAEDHRLHPVATVVSYLIHTQMEAHPARTIAGLRSVLSQVTHGVMLTDPPYQTQFPETCITSAGATMGSCSVRIPRVYEPFQKALVKMTTASHFPLIPVLQWFCGDGICPTVIDSTLVTGDRSHLTVNYSADLSRVMGLALTPILDRFEATSSAR